MSDYQNALLFDMRKKCLCCVFLFPIFIWLFIFQNPYPFQKKQTVSSPKSDLWVFLNFWVDLVFREWVKMEKIQPKGGSQPKYHNFFTDFLFYFLHAFCGFSCFVLYFPFWFDFSQWFEAFERWFEYFINFWLFRVLFKISHWF